MTGVFDLYGNRTPVGGFETLEELDQFLFHNLEVSPGRLEEHWSDALNRRLPVDRVTLALFIYLHAPEDLPGYSNMKMKARLVLQAAAGADLMAEHCDDAGLNAAMASTAIFGNVVWIAAAVLASERGFNSATITSAMRIISAQEPYERRAS